MPFACIALGDSSMSTNSSRPVQNVAGQPGGGLAGWGQYLRAVTWLKIVYWHHDGKLTPLEVILKAYVNMPNVARSDFA
ncbi:hypothetical protein ACVMIX_007364 [Rhizobium leguminosarum]